MCVSDDLVPAARALLLTGVLAFGLAGIVGSGSDTGQSEETPDTRIDGYISLSETALVVARGESALLRVDVAGLPTGEGVSGYSISLSEAVSNIDIATATCPSGVGTVSCQHWTITPGARSVPGKYAVEVRAVGTPRRVFQAELAIEVTDVPAQAGAAAIATQGLVLTTDGRLWATGDNRRGQSGVGALSSCGFDAHPCAVPDSVSGYVVVGNDADWIDVVAGIDVSVAVRSNGTLWVWGDNHESLLGFPIADPFLPVPRQLNLPVPGQVAGATDVRSVSIGIQSFLALRQNRTVYAWGLPIINRCDLTFEICEHTATLEPKLVPIDIDADGTERFLTDVVQVAGGSNNVGVGFALALRADGSVWQWGQGRFVQATEHAVLGESYHPLYMPLQVAGLPSEIRAISAGSMPTSDNPNATQKPYALALDADGNVWTWNRIELVAALVAGLDRIVAVEGQVNGNATALRDDGTVWIWEPGVTTPAMVAGLPTIARLGRNAAGYQIAADCSSGGSVWRFSTPGESQEFGPVRRRPEFGSSIADGCPVPAMARLTVSHSGDGVVLSQPLYLHCGNTCEALVPLGTRLRLIPRPSPGWRHLDTDGPGCDAFLFAMTADMNCSFTFVQVPDSFTLSVSIAAGKGRVTSVPDGIDCPGDCSQNYVNVGAPVSVSLSALADPGYRFSEFRGNERCANTTSIVTASFHCEAVFVALPAPAMPSGLNASAQASSITLAWAPVNDNSVARYTLERSQDGSPFEFIAGLNDTANSYSDTDVIPATSYTYRLIAINDSGSSAPATATATIRPSIGFTLNVQVTGAGSVSSVPAGISCAPDCSESYSLVTNVTLTASADANSQFEGWTGDCAGTAPMAVVTVDRDRACSAEFTTPTARGWNTIASRVLTSEESHVQSSVALDSSGRAYAALVQVVGSQSRLAVYQEVPSGLFVNRGVVNANQTWDAFDAELVLDDEDRPIVAFTNGDSVAVVRLDGPTFTFLSERINLGPAAGLQPQLVRSGNTLVVAWIEGGRIAVRRRDLITGVWENDVSLPNTQNAQQLDLALDSAGRGVIASTFGSLGSELRVWREMADGSWVPLGEPVGVRPPDAPIVMALGLHIDAADVVRIVWTEGDFSRPIPFAYLSAAYFDGADWTSLFGAGFTPIIRRDLALPRALSVNRSGPFAFAFAIETTLPGPINNLVDVYELPGGVLTPNGSLLAQPGTGHLSLAMQQPGRLTLAQSIATAQNPSEPFTLRVLRHIP